MSGRFTKNYTWKEVYAFLNIPSVARCRRRDLILSEC